MAPPPGVSGNSTFKSLEDVAEWPKKLLHLTVDGKFGRVREATLRDNLKRRSVGRSIPDVAGRIQAGNRRLVRWTVAQPVG